MKSIETRLKELQMEFEKGEQQLAALDRQRQAVRDTMLRISGAIQVLEELLQQQAPEDKDSVSPKVNELREVPAA